MDQGKVSLKKVLPLIVSTGKVMLLVEVESGISNQFVLRPVATELVCICKRQPVWSLGHESVNMPPATEFVMLGGEVSGR